MFNQASIDKVTSGLTVITAVLFITGEMTGSGVLALPKAVKDAGWVSYIDMFAFVKKAYATPNC